MQKKTIQIAAKHTGLVVRAFQEISGPRPIMLAYKIGQIVQVAQELQQALVKAVAPYVTDDGQIRANLDEEESAVVQAFLDEELTMEIPCLTVAEIAMHDKLSVSDDTVFAFLVDAGVLEEGDFSAAE